MSRVESILSDKAGQVMHQRAHSHKSTLRHVCKYIAGDSECSTFVPIPEHTHTCMSRVYSPHEQYIAER